MCESLCRTIGDDALFSRRMLEQPFNLGDHLPTITAGRLRLRWLTDADIPALFEIFGDAMLCRYWSHEPFKSIDDARQYLNEIRDCFAKRELFQWGIELHETNEIIGTCTLAHLDAQHKRAEVGFALARAHWGKGYISEVVPAIIRFAFEELGLERLTADADPRNHGSIRALERAGFVREGYLRSHYRIYGEVQDAVTFGLLRSETADHRSATDRTGIGNRG